MTDILSKVQLYLDKAAKEPVEISDKLVEEFGEACKNALRKQFSEERRKEFRIGAVFTLLVLILVYRRFKLSRKREYLK